MIILDFRGLIWHLILISNHFMTLEMKKYTETTLDPTTSQSQAKNQVRFNNRGHLLEYRSIFFCSLHKVIISFLFLVLDKQIKWFYDEKYDVLIFFYVCVTCSSRLFDKLYWPKTNSCWVLFLSSALLHHFLYIYLCVDKTR